MEEMELEWRRGTKRGEMEQPEQPDNRIQGRRATGATGSNEETGGTEQRNGEQQNANNGTTGEQ